MIELNERVAAIADTPADRGALIVEYKPFILKCASDCAKHYITDKDDEWSIALQGFSEAIDKYKIEEGSFLSFAKLIIRRRMYDYFDLNSKYSREVLVAPSMFSGEMEDEEEITEIHLQVQKSLVCEQETSVTDEIEAANGMLANYGFSFFDLTACSPKAGKTKERCAKAAAFMLENPILVSEMQRTRQLPIKIVEQKTAVPRKILERHRKYIIAAVELYSGDYPNLKEYLHNIGEELGK